MQALDHVLSLGLTDQVHLDIGSMLITMEKRYGVLIVKTTR